jgi:hypothetical protein
LLGEIGCKLGQELLRNPSAADQEGVAGGLLEHVKGRAKADRCRSIRIWSLAAENWRSMQDQAFLARWDHGLMMKV